MAEDFPYFGTLRAVHKGQDRRVDEMLVRSFANTTLARAYLGNAITGKGSGSEVQVTFDTEVFDLGANLADSKYVAPCPGYFHIDWCVYMMSDGGTLTGGLSYLNKNATSSSGAVGYSAYAGAIGGQLVSPGNSLLYLAQGDYLTISATGITSASTWKMPATAMTFLAAHLVAKP